MNVTLLEQHSRATCVHGVSFGSNSNRPAGVHILPKQLASASVVELFWVRNCRGVFRCGPTGSPIACGYPVGRPSYTCRCDSPVWSFAKGANIGRWESCGVWSNASEPEREPATPRQTRRSDLLLVIGVITGPGATERRRWLRHNAWSVARHDFEQVFIVGHLNKRSAAPRHVQRIRAEQHQRIRAEHAAFGDLLEVDAMEASASSVAEKTLAWYRRALDLYPHARHVAKADDDSMPNFRTLLADLAALQSPVLYYGVMRWRLWQPSHINGACGAGGAGGGYGRPFSPTAARLVEELYAARTTGECAGAVGPYLYADGSLHVLGHALLRHTLSSATAARFIAERSSSHNWRHEDVGIGYLVHAALVANSSMRAKYVVLRGWAQNKFWVEVDDPSTFPTEHTVWTHHVRAASTAAAVRPCIDERWTAAPTFFNDTDCGRTLGWRDAPKGVECVIKAPCSGRLCPTF